jgi:hypothetical protein
MPILFLGALGIVGELFGGKRPSPNVVQIWPSRPSPASQKPALFSPYKPERIEHVKPWPAALSPSSIRATINAMELDMHWLMIITAIVLTISSRTLADE